MQLSAALQHQHRYRGGLSNLTFANHTPRYPQQQQQQQHEFWGSITSAAVSPSQSLFPPDMFGPGPGMIVGAGPVYDDTVMGQASPNTLAHSSNHPVTTTSDALAHAQREKIRKTNSMIWKEDSIHQYFEANSRFPSPRSPLTTVEQPIPLSRPDSWSMHYDCTTQAPYATTNAPTPAASVNGDRMITNTSLLKLPPGNASRELADFLRTTGPPAPHRKPSKIEQHPQRIGASKSTLRLFRKRQVTPVQSAHGRLNGILRDDDYQIPDEGGLLNRGPVSEGCEQKISSAGKLYLVIKPKVDPTTGIKADTDHPMGDYHQPLALSQDILESRVSICFHDDVTSATGEVLHSYSDTDYDEWLLDLANKQRQKREAEEERSKPASSCQEVASRLARQRHNPTLIRPAASEPPSPVPESAMSIADSYHSDVYDRPPPKLSFDGSQALANHSVSPIQESQPYTPNISLPKEEFPVKHPSPEKEVEIKHPLPRRLGSHSVLLQRGSSIVSTMYQRSVSDSLYMGDSPGPPPPRSPLRLRRDPRTIETTISSHEPLRKGTPIIAPNIKSAHDFNFDMDPIRATVTTECTGPIKRPKSRGKAQKSGSPQLPYSATRREREERVRARKLRDRPSAVNRTIDSVVHAPAQATRRSLRRLRPQITIPDLRPAPLRAPSVASHISAASSAASGNKITQSTLAPISPAPSLASHFSEDDNTGYTPISPTASAEGKAAQAGLARSPMMFIAEEVPVPKTKAPPKPVKLVIKEPKSKSYAPRPRSASLPRNALMRQSRNSNNNSLHSSPRASSPVLNMYHDEAPSLPSPPPTRALPPTPPASGSEKPNIGSKRIQSKELVPIPSASQDISPPSTTSKKNPNLSHITTQRRPSGQGPSRPANRATSRIDARLEALERQNAMLSAALMAVLKTNGTLTDSIPGLNGLVTSDPDSVKAPMMAWETRVARRSAASTNTAASYTASSSNGSALEMYISTRRGIRHEA